MVNENKKVFVDTNILIYAYSDTEIEKKDAVLSLLENETVCLSTQVVSEFIWVMSRKFDVDMQSLRLISDNLFKIYKISLISNATIAKAIDTALQFNFSYWDSLIVASAIESGCNILYTEDLQHGQVIDNRLSILSPFI